MEGDETTLKRHKQVKQNKEMEAFDSFASGVQTVSSQQIGSV